MSRRTALLVAVCLLGAGGPAAAQAGPSWQDLRTFYQQTAQREGIIGGSLLLIQGGRTIGPAPYGMADLASGRAVDSNTIFHWASITKTFTAIAIMQLRDRGLLSLDDPIVKYVPELREVHDPYGPVDSITIRHLLSHSAGFRNPTWPWGGDQPWQPFEPTRWAQLVAMMPYTGILFRPGSRYSYSNPGFIFLGRVIEALTGDDYEVYMEKNVLRPLGMRHSYFDRTPYHLLRYRSNNYTVTNGTPVPNGLDFDTGITVSNGGLNAPLTDMARYLRFLVGATGLTEEAKNVLARSSLEEMWRPQVPVEGVANAKEFVGLSFFIHDEGAVRVIGHTGSQASFRSFFYVHPETKSAIIAVFNTVAADGEAHPTVAPLFDGLRERFLAGVTAER
ncbi:MAG: serine hydrolase domain-containing protein [Gemmatimonadales bacterium]